jgi:hypothetical protein
MSTFGAALVLSGVLLGPGVGIIMHGAAFMQPLLTCRHVYDLRYEHAQRDIAFFKGRISLAETYHMQTDSLHVSLVAAQQRAHEYLIMRETCRM